MDKQIKLSHYEQFHCIADKCQITCCQEWKIPVDDATEKAWQERKLQKHICMKDGAHVIQLNKEKQCPF